MQKNTCILFIIVSIFAIGSHINTEQEITTILVSISLIMAACIIQLFKNIIEKYEKVLTIIQLMAFIICLYFKIFSVIYLLPIIIFEYFNSRVNITMSICISMGLSMIFYRENIFNIALYTVIVNLYLYEEKAQHISNIELKEVNRGERYEKHIMEEKLNNLEKYIEQNNIMTSLRERNFIAQKLHDHLGHRITSSLMQLEVTKETLNIDNEMSKKYLESAMANLRDGMEEIREVLKNVKPKERTLTVEDIKEQLLKFQYSSGISTSLNIYGELDRIRLNLLIVIEENLKEALTNAAKYSKATKIDVSILIYNKILRVEIKDNGVGKETKGESLGLRGIRERVEAIGGRLEYFSDGGFIINMIFNLGDKNEH